MEKKKLYFEAPMFNLADCFFNFILSEELGNYFHLILPQRDGFEFSKLSGFLKGRVENPENIVNHLIYYLDIGRLLPQSDFCVARLDEPSDPGVDVELMEAKKIGIPRIGFRTDVRSPYGSSGNEVRGAHFFPSYNCNTLINFSYVDGSRQEIRELANLIHEASEEIIAKHNGRLPHKNINITSGTHYIGTFLFSNLDIHSEKGMEEVLKRYNKLKEAGNTNPGNTKIINS